MTAVLVPTASEAEWLEARRKGVTASEIAILMGLSPYSSPYALYHQKLGILPGQDDSPAMERGRVLEPYVVQKFGELHPELMVVGSGRELFRHEDRPWQMATPDRMLCDDMRLDFDGDTVIEEFEPLALLETKTASDMSDWGEPGTDEIPVHYRCQVLWQMDVTGVGKAYVTVLDIPRWEVREYVIEHNPAGHIGDSTGEQPQGDCEVCDDQQMMRGEARLFLDRIARGEAPDVDWRPATIGALKQLHPSVTDEDVFVGSQVATRYRAAVRNFKYWEKRKHLYEAQLRQQMGPARRAWSGGEVIARRDVYEVGESARKAYTVDKLVPVKPKKEKTS